MYVYFCNFTKTKRRLVVTDILEAMIMKYSMMGFPFTSKEVRDIAFEYAMDHNLKGFSEDLGSAGPAWFRYFLLRHAQLSLKTATNLSLARAMSSNKILMDQWFTQYEDVLRQLKINDPKYLWNVDEHSAEDLVKTKKVVGIKGIKSFQTQSREKARCTTIITYLNVSGYTLPPMTIHRGKYHNHWCMNAPRRVLVCSSKKGYINKQLFAEYGKMLLYHLHAQGQLDRPNLIVMDSHYSHTFNYCYMNIMYTHDIKLIGIKSQTSHLNQPLHKNLFVSLKDSFNSEMCRYN